MNYVQPIDDDHRGCFVFLVDQSYSMLEPAVGREDRSKAQATADTLNACLYDLLHDRRGGRSLAFDVGVIGYGQDVRPGLTGRLGGRDLLPADEVVRHPLAAGGDRSLRPGAAGVRPAWVEPTASGATPMTAALDRCRAALAPWVDDHPDSFPPVVVNISDGAATDGDPLTAATLLRALGTTDGAALLFNVSLSAKAGRPILFAADEGDLPHEASRRLFRLSSPLPERLRSAAAALGHATRPGARGFVCDADLDALALLLRVGVSPALGMPDQEPAAEPVRPGTSRGTR